MSPKTQKLLARAGVIATSMALSTAAYADAGTDAILGLETTADLYIAAAFSLAVVTVVGFFGIRLFKKVARVAA